MTKIYYILIVAILGTCQVLGRTAADTLMTIDGKPILLEDYLQYCRASDISSKDMRGRFHDYLEFRLKVAIAEHHRLDTMPDFIMQLRSVEHNSFCAAETVEALQPAVCSDCLNRERRLHGCTGWVKYEMLTYRMSQHISPSAEQEVKRIVDQVYRQLNMSDHHDMSAYAGVMQYESEEHYVPVDDFIDEMAEAISVTGIGCISQPFFSAIGMHILRVTDKTKHIIETDVQWLAYCMHISPDKNRSQSNHHAKDVYTHKADASSSNRQIYEGLMCMYSDNCLGDIFAAEAPGEKELKSYFRENKKAYAWEFPHFKGSVVFCQNAKDAKKIKRRIRRKSLQEHSAQVKSMVDNGEIGKAYLQSGLYCIGEDAYVDFLAFGCGTMVARKECPYAFVRGEVLDDGPEEYKDVLQAVQRDWQKSRRDKQMAALKKKYKVEVFMSVLDEYLSLHL